VGKWKTCFWFSTFPSALIVEAVGMWESRPPLARFPRGSWKEGKACLWLSTLSTAPAFPQLCVGFVGSRRTFQERDRQLRHGRVRKRFAAGQVTCRPYLGSSWSRALAAARPATHACLARLPFLQSSDPCESRLQILALVSDFQFELPPLKAHQHAAELLPGDLSTIDV
jgi:hypothetical protein